MASLSSFGIFVVSIKNFDADDTDFADLKDEDMDEEKNNRLGEPEMVYERRTSTFSQHRRRTVDELMEIIRREHPRMYAEDPDLRKHLEELENPKPMTRQEIDARIDEAEAEIKAGVPGLTTEEAFNLIKRHNPWLLNHL